MCFIVPVSQWQAELQQLLMVTRSTGQPGSERTRTAMHPQHELANTGGTPRGHGPDWCRSLARRLPFYYGWLVFAIVAGTNYAARPLMSVAVLSVFVLPMTQEFGWSRGLFSGAVSLGGLGAVVVSPLIGRLLDRQGARVILSVTSAVTGLCAIGLSLIHHTWTFYALYVPGRMGFASPLELAASTALSNWFTRRRALALALHSVTQGTGLAAMPFVAQLLISGWGWRQAWATLGVYTLAVGIVPAVLFMARRPEDLGLAPDSSTARRRTADATPAQSVPSQAQGQTRSEHREVHCTLREALSTRAFWVLSAFAAVGFMTQAGISLHQVSHYMHQGLQGTVAALIASTFALSQVPAGLLWSALTRRLPVRVVLALAGLAVALGAAGTALASTLVSALIAACILGSGVGGLHLLVRLVWADYYGRQYLGTIQGITLPVQVGGQAIGPIAAGFVFDATGEYYSVFVCFAALVAAGSLLVLAAVPPHRAAAPGAQVPV
jgi:OFA family oxalate/formate antiporter-like MFS transporter